MKTVESLDEFGQKESLIGKYLALTSLLLVRPGKKIFTTGSIINRRDFQVVPVKLKIKKSTVHSHYKK